TRPMSWRGSWITTVGPRSILGRSLSVNASYVFYEILACALKWNKRNGPDTSAGPPLVWTHQSCSHRLPVLSYAIDRMKIFIFVLPSCERNSWLGGAFSFSLYWCLRPRDGHLWQEHLCMWPQLWRP